MTDAVFLAGLFCILFGTVIVGFYLDAYLKIHAPSWFWRALGVTPTAIWAIWGIWAVWAKKD